MQRLHVVTEQIDFQNNWFQFTSLNKLSWVNQFGENWFDQKMIFIFLEKVKGIYTGDLCYGNM